MAAVNQKSKLPLMEAFYSIQGEGFHQGKAAYFVRLGGCDVGCVWCDVKESWDVSQFPKVEVGKISDQAAEFDSKIAIVTGGEPLMYNLNELTDSLQSKGMQTHIETSGAYPITGKWDWITFSPKKFKKPLAEFLDRSDELKVVIYNKTDFDWAESFALRMNKKAKLYLQPEWSKVKTVLPLIIDYVKAHPKWEISLQIHKYMEIP
jgi:organic radical activating enzyme